MIPTMTAAQAAERLRAEGLRITPETVREGILQGQFPFGVCIMDGSRVKSCPVFSVLLDRWIEERSKS